MVADIEKELLRVMRALLKEQKLTNALMTSLLNGSPAIAKLPLKPSPSAAGSKNLFRRYAS